MYDYLVGRTISSDKLLIYAMISLVPRRYKAMLWYAKWSCDKVIGDYEQLNEYIAFRQ